MLDFHKEDLPVGMNIQVICGWEEKFDCGCTVVDTICR